MNAMIFKTKTEAQKEVNGLVGWDKVRIQRYTWTTDKEYKGWIITAQHPGRTNRLTYNADGYFN